MTDETRTREAEASTSGDTAPSAAPVAPPATTEEATSQPTTPAAPSVAAVAAPRRPSALRRFFWMDEQLSAAKLRGYGAGQPGYAEYSLARQAQAGVLQIGESGESSLAVLLLQTEAVRLLFRAHCLRAELDPPSVAIDDADLERLRRIDCIREALDGLTQAQQASLLQLLRVNGEAKLAELEPKQRRALAGALKSLLVATIEPLEHDESKVGRVLFARVARITAAIVVVGGAVAMLLSLLAGQMKKPNIALKKKVTTSSLFASAGRDTRLLVDGDTTNLGFHTECRPNQTVTVDLGASHPISSVVVYNRADCCQERAVPLVLEVSADNRKFDKVKEQREQFDKWVVDGVDKKARYVRITNTSNNCFHLSELEVY